MIFFSYQFASFTAVFFVLYWLTAWPKARRILILCACLIFHYHFAGPAGVLPIVFLGTGAYLIALSRNRLLCLVWIAVCVCALIFYKYTHFLFQNAINFVFPDLAATSAKTIQGFLPALPPLGISFFAFEFVHYLVEIYRGHRPIRSPITFALFSVFWPSLVAGPIKRYRQFVVSMARGVRMVNGDDIVSGATRVSIGVVKKFAGDFLTGWIDHAYPTFEQLPIEQRWIFVAGVGARILLDFSGYSDMAIGFARMMGIRLPENFNWPYLARNISDFWRRWHISLSTWIRDYIYIPLGGSRHGPALRALNALFAMALCGLWHGAAWNFALWGIYHGLGLVAVNALSRDGAPFSDRISVLMGAPEPVRKGLAAAQWLVSWTLTMIFVHIGWLLFFYPVESALRMTKLLFIP